jgi:putative membrane protein
LRVVLAVAGLGFVAYLVHQAGAREVWESIHSLSWRFVLLLVPFAAVTTLGAAAWRLAMVRARAPFPRLWVARVAGEALNAATPTASVGGEPVKAYLLRAWVPLEQGLASVIIDKTTIAMGQAFFLAAGILISLGPAAPSGPITAVMLGALALEAIGVGGFVLVQLRGVAGGGGRLLSRLGIGPSAARLARLDDLDRSLSSFYRRHPCRLVGAVLCHLVAWAVGSLEIYLVLRFLTVPVSLPAALAMEAFGTAVRFVSFMIPGSIGALEGGNVAIFAAFGVGGGVGLACTLVRRLREAVWVALGLVALAAIGGRPPAASDRMC